MCVIHTRIIKYIYMYIYYIDTIKTINLHNKAIYKNMSREKNGAFNPGNQTVDLMQKFADRMNRNSKKLVVPFNEGSNKLAKQLKLEQYRQAFLRDGFVVVPNVFSKEEIIELRTNVKNAVLKRKEEFGKLVPASERNTYDSQFTQCLNLWEDFSNIRKFTFHPKVCQVASAILGFDLRVWQDQALVKPSGGRATIAHQDVSLMYIYYLSLSIHIYIYI